MWRRLVLACVATVVGFVSCGGSTRDDTDETSSRGTGGLAAVEAGIERPPECEPMDAREGADGDCGASDFPRFTWDGDDCVRIACCTGSDCERTFVTADECDRVHALCYDARRRVKRTCASDNDCRLVPRGCCDDDSVSRADQVVAVSRASANRWRSMVCLVGSPCDGEPGSRNPALRAFCDKGQCTAVDLGAYVACTVDADCTLATRSCCSVCTETPLNDLVAVNALAVPAYEARWCAEATPTCGPSCDNFPPAIPRCMPQTGTCELPEAAP